MRVRVSKIVWDRDADEGTPPRKKTYEVTMADVEPGNPNLISEAMDKVSDRTGWCIMDAKVQYHNGQRWTEIV